MARDTGCRVHALLQAHAEPSCCYCPASVVQQRRPAQAVFRQAAVQCRKIRLQNWLSVKGILGNCWLHS